MKLSDSEKSRLRKNYGQWAIITGASSGIGLELAKQLAGSGLNLIINSRNLVKLSEAEKQLKAIADVEIRMVLADLSESTGIDRIIQSAKGLNIGLLVVSAGYGTSGIFVNNSLQSELNMLRVNCEAVVALTHYFGRKFVQQKRGGIIFLSSILAFQGTPYAANYAATKAYIQSFSEALAIEMKTSGVDVLAAAPGPVESSFGQRANMKMSMSMTPSQIGVPIIKALGRKTTALPGLLTKILVYSLKMVPRWGKVRIMEIIMRGMTEHQRKS